MFGHGRSAVSQAAVTAGLNVIPGFIVYITVVSVAALLCRAVGMFKMTEIQEAAL